MKKAFALILALVCCLSLFGCGTEKTVISDIGEYDSLWTLRDRLASFSSFLFPTSVDEDSVLCFRCEHETSVMYGAKWQVILELEYESETFSFETDKIKALCNGSLVYGENEYFEEDAYASVWNESGIFEYALVNSAEQKITYIYLQRMDKDEINLDEKYIPEEYKMEMKTDSFSVY